MKYNLKEKLNATFLKLLLIPIVLLIVFVFITLILLRGYMFTEIENIEMQKATKILQTGLHLERDFLEYESVLHNKQSLTARVQELLKIPQPYNAKMILLNKDKKILMSHSVKFKLNQKYLHSILRHIVKNKLDVSQANIHNTEYIIIQTSLHSMQSNLMLLVEKNEILKTVELIKDISRTIVVSILIFFFLLLYFVYKYSAKKFTKLSNNIIDPIIQLSVISSNIEKFQQTLPRFKTNIVEVDELGENFTQMIKELHSKTNTLKEFNTNLEQKIKEATKHLREKNEMTEKLFSTIMESVCIWDENYNLIDINNTTYKIFGFQTKEEIIGKNIFEFIPPEEQYKIQESLSKSYEINLYKTTNELFPALVKGNDTYINGTLHRILTIVDLSDVKEKDKLLVLQSKQAQMGEMISMIAHQWRQPLNAISASSINLSLLSSMDMLEEQKVQESSEFIQDQCQKMSATIDTFMNFVKPSQQSKRFLLTQTLDSIMDIMKSQLTNHNIKVVRNNIDKEAKVTGYEDLLEQVILNILTNARDAFEEITVENKTINITIKIKNCIPTIFIEDNAGGIPRNIQEKIFNPYFTTKEQGKGTGIGLYMSIDIMQKSFHGNLFYHETDSGSCFEIACGGGE